MLFPVFWIWPGTTRRVGEQTMFPWEQLQLEDVASGEIVSQRTLNLNGYCDRGVSGSQPTYGCGPYDLVPSVPGLRDGQGFLFNPADKS
jgi:hypothetical protein